jgi:hypothetical protein
MASKANVSWNTRTQISNYLGGGILASTGGASGNEVSWDVWLDAGTYKYAQIHITSSIRGIYSCQLDGVEKGTIDGYSTPGSATNVYTEITGIAVTAGVKVFRLLMATRNAAAIDWIGSIHSGAWIRTGA